MISKLIALLKHTAFQWNVLIVPVFCAVLLLTLRAWGQLTSVTDYVFEIAGKSVTILIAVALTHLVTKGLLWNIDNDYRRQLQDAARDKNYGAWFLLTLEFLSVSTVLTIFIWALTIWQRS